MSEPVYIVGLDIGTTKIACIVGEKKPNGKIEILGYGKTDSTGVKRGMVINIEETVGAIKRAVAEASEQSKIDIKSVNVGIAGHHIKSLQHRGMLIRENADVEISDAELNKLRDDMYKIGTSPGEEIVNVIPQEYFIDGEPIGNHRPKGMLGNKIEANFHIIIGQSAAVRNIITCIEHAGLEMNNMFLEPIASAAAVLDEEEKEAGVAIVDIGGGTTDIAVFYDSIIYHTAVIPFGGNIITEDIRQGCSILKKHAEEIKVKFGSAVASENSEDEVVSIPGMRGREAKEISFKNLAYIIQSRLEEIFDLVNFEIQKVNSDHKLIAGIVLTGGGSMMKHIAQLAEFKTGMEVRLGNPNESLAKSTDDLSSPMYSTGIGLVIEGFAKYESDVSRGVVTEENKNTGTKRNVSDDEEAEEKETKNNKTEKPKSEGFSIRGIITGFTDFFKQENLDK
ncbi:MAG: cell division protein FtsA [Bacteroidales bacterium]|nr:cell division protein FtsA [Bacteroidales bacterium]